MRGRGGETQTSLFGPCEGAVLERCVAGPAGFDAFGEDGGELGFGGPEEGDGGSGDGAAFAVFV